MITVRPNIPVRAVLFFLILVPTFSLAQQASISIKEPGSVGLVDTNSYKKRKMLITGVHTLGYAGSLALLHQAWYDEYEKTNFHTFNDAKEWLQMDKVGHAWTSYNIVNVSSGMWRWAGMKERKSAILAAAGGTTFLTLVELLDAYSEKWGWSWYDIASNLAGSAMFLSQEFAWQEQRIQFKFSFHRQEYPDGIAELMAENLFGNSWYERMLKDYNGQTFWLSFNLNSLGIEESPEWLNISLGYGAEGLLGGFKNLWEREPGIFVERTDIKRNRQFYLSPDIDFTKIKTSSKLLRTVLYFANILKMPAPALMLDSEGNFRVYGFYF